KINGEIVLELEITPNRPDLLSVIGIAREIAAITGKKIKYPNILLSEKKENLPLTVNINFDLFSRYSGLIIKDINIAPSPAWLQRRLILIGLRPINNVVDITNYVMYELGLPLHAFDYDKIAGHQINVMLSSGGEDFTSVDEISYQLPKNAIIIKDKDKLIDLAGIKGGLNSAISQTTKTVYVHVTVDQPVLIRKASQALSLRSDASAIYERGVDPGGTVTALKRAAQLILETAGGNLASDIIDLKKKEFLPWNLTLSFAKSERILGIKIAENEVVNILSNLNLSPQVNQNTIRVTVPTYRQDLKIEEDLIEEVARIYGYNRFPKTLPQTPPPVNQIAYFKNYSVEFMVKNLLMAAGFTELSSYSLVSSDLITADHNKTALRILNPVSGEYEYLRSSLIPNLLNAIRQNQANIDKIDLFELGKIYRKNDNSSSEQLSLAFVTNNKTFAEFKGVTELIFNRMNIDNIDYIPLNNNSLSTIYSETETAEILLDNKSIGRIGKIKSSIAQQFALKKIPYALEIDFNSVSQFLSYSKYTAVPIYPPYIEDLSFIVPSKVLIGNLIKSIKKEKYVKRVDLLDKFENNLTFRIIYQSKDKNLTAQEIKSVRNKIISAIHSEFKAKLKA
ncbi:phenylalanine--tRNA ligase subunit beta, partial [Candidatus Gottesmanbacteria bacterium RBG_16_37_8]